MGKMRSRWRWTGGLGAVLAVGIGLYWWGSREEKPPFSGEHALHLVRKAWEAAEEVGASAFVSERGRAVMDDHVPLLREGIPMINLIQTPFPWYWHTTKDTPDRCSTESLDQVGEVLVEMIYDE